jgi:hypothetical protein
MLDHMHQPPPEVAARAHAGGLAATSTLADPGLVAELIETRVNRS